MAVLRIRKYGDPILKEKASKVKKISKKVKELANNMVETMFSLEAIGLAAVQVGVLKRIIVFSISSEKEKNAGILINPKIISKEGEELAEEGCLSIPGVNAQIKRAASITTTGVNIEGKEIKFSCSGLLARVIQHEIDHLNGVLFIDHMDKKSREEIKEKLIKIKEESKKSYDEDR